MKMSMRFTVLGLLFLFSTWAVLPVAAQTATTAIVLGTVSDKGSAVVPDAEVELVNAGTNETKTVKTNSSGQYAFPNVVPGTYNLKFTKQGFATTSISNIKIDVDKSYTQDVTLEISSGKEVIEVSAQAQAELQTTDAVVGNVVGETELMRLPTLGRDSRELLTLQPMSTPFESSNGGGFGNSGGTIAGARSDQNVFNLDGIDITDNVIAGGGNQAPIIPIGVENISEFRVGVTNNNASFGRSEGGQINIISKSGTNDYHGSVYWYHQNSALNANTWDNGHTPDGTGNQFTQKQPQHDNRGGVSFGGPIKKDKTFVFGNYEIRRFPQSVEVERIVPTTPLRNGILTFNGVPYNLATSTACGPSGTLACDPRGIGISPTIQQLWNMLPAGNDPNVGDGVNTEGFRTSVAEPLKDDFVNFRLDHNFTDKVKFFGRYMYHRDLAPNASGQGGQVDFLGGATSAVSASDIRGDGFIAGLDWTISSNLINTFHVGWIRSRQDFNVIRPRVSAATLNLPGTQSPLGDIALAPGLGQTGLIDTVVDVDTQRARHQAIYDSNKQYADNLTWIKGKHTLVTGADIRWLPTIHDRDDKVIGSVNSLVATLDSDVVGFGIPAANRPPGIPVNEQQNWDRLYAASLGLVNSVGILAVRDGNLNPKPLGASLVAKTTLRAYNFFVQDSWRLKPSFTLTYGLGYGWQTTPHELNQQQTFIANHDTGDSIISGLQYIQAKMQAAQNGDVYNPTLSYIPIRDSGRSDVFNVDYGDWAPRASAAWNPSFRDGFLGRIFGDRKTVVRGGYGIAYDRVNTVQSVIIPMLGVGFAQTINVQSPACSFSGTPGTACNVDTTPGGSIFRVGVDGQIPTPPVPGSLTSPIVPPVPLSETLSFQNDPNFKDGRAHMVDFTIQRSLPGQMILELGYVGRFGRNLAGSINFNSSPYMFKDKTSGQIFAQAFDAVATQLRAGVSPILSNGSPNPAFQNQPWFENQLAGYGATCGAGISATACLASNNSTSFSNVNLSSLFLNMDIARQFVLGQQPYDNLQVLDLFMRDSNDRSNYNAFVVTLRNNNWHGLLFDLNYTFSKSLDTVGAVQNAAEYHTSSYDFNLDYGPSFFNRPNVFNGIFNYDLPIGGNHRLSSSHAAINKILSGWFTAGIFRASSGVPELASVSGQSFGGGLIFGITAGELPTVPIGSMGGGGVNSGVCSTGAGSGGNGANCGANKGTGTGLNYFTNPSAAINDFRQVLISSDKNDGRNSPLPGLGFWNFDLSIGKSTKITERVKFQLSADFFNLFNHVNFLDPSFDTTTPSTFGVINTQLVPADRIQGSRWIQLGLRVDF
ncbi:MAG TPA: carboxypeptidase-like regulatory domain-containing protein [Candidatus Acidoferrum sp.]|nr:carboxypeptidase-like regulatory domain-containing protein [Candidatus Acidoferrum sp.]